MALTDNLVAYWKLDEASGTRADSVGSNTLTDNNTVLAATGKINDAADFESGNSESLSIADNADVSMGNFDFTVQAWVKLESKVGTGFASNILGKWSSGGGYEYVLYYDGTSDRFAAFVTADSTFGAGLFSLAVANNGGSPSLATFYLVHVWYTASDDLVRISVNAGTADVGASTSSSVQNGTSAFTIGSHDGGNYFDGLIDEAALWKRVLTSQERTDLYNSGNGLAYPFTTAAGAGHRIIGGGWGGRTIGA